MIRREHLLLGVLMSGSATTALVLVVLLPVLPMLAANFGGGAAGAQLSQSVMTSPALGLIVGGFLSAAAIKSLGAYRLLLIGLFLYGLMGTAGLYLSDAPTLLGSRFMLGVAASFIGIASTALIAVLFTGQTRARLIGYKGALGSVGGIAGILIGGELGSIGGWRLPFAIYFFAWLLFVLAVMGRPKRVASAATDTPAEAQPPGSLISLWPFYAVIVMFGVVLMMTVTQLSFLLAEIGVTEPSEVSRIAVMASIGAMVGGFGYGRVVGWIGARNAFPTIFAIWTLGLAMLGFSMTPEMTVVACAITGVAAGLFLPHMITTLAAAAPDHVRDRAIAMFYSAIFLGDFLNPFIVEPISVALTRHGAFQAVAGFTFLALMVSLWLRWRKPEAMPQL